MSRSLYVFAWAWLLLCAVALLQPEATVFVEPAASAPLPASGGPAWFARVKPLCNPVEVEVGVRRNPPPAGAEGSAWLAACYALAGKTERARAVIDALPGERRGHAADVVFWVGHPVADAGDDEAAGPIMSLVVEYRPDHAMALYHAGMAEYALGHHAAARRHLLRFRQHYTAEDGWRANAGEVLGRLGVAEAP
jgi:hypothetical protein